MRAIFRWVLFGCLGAVRVLGGVTFIGPPLKPKQEILANTAYGGKDYGPGLATGDVALVDGGWTRFFARWPGG